MAKLLIIKNICKKVHIHPLYYWAAFLATITGFFKDYIILSLLIIIHEVGHLLTALAYGWKIDKIVIFPFGGLTQFKEHLNKPIKEEFIILLMGPLCQCFFYFLISTLKQSYLLTNYHYSLLFFNLLPIIPLDGSKLINLLSNLFFPFKTSHLIIIYLSFFLLMGLLVYSFNNLIFLCFLLFLLIKIISEYKMHSYLFNKFLMERFIYKFSFKKSKIIKGVNLSKMYRDYRHLFKTPTKLYKEATLLQKRFDKSHDL